MKLIITSVLVMLLAACTHDTVIVREPYGVPTPIVPHPPEVVRPVVELDLLPERSAASMTEAEKGEYVKAYRLTALAWKQYAELLEPIIAQYKVAATQSDEARAIIEGEIAVLSEEAAEIIRKIEVREKVKQK